MAEAAGHHGHRNVHGNGDIDDFRLVAVHSVVHSHFGVLALREHFIWMHVEKRRHGEFLRRELVKHNRLDLNGARFLEVESHVHDIADFRSRIQVEQHQVRAVGGHDGVCVARDVQLLDLVHLDNAVTILVARQMHPDLNAV